MPGKSRRDDASRVRGRGRRGLAEAREKGPAPVVAAPRPARPVPPGHPFPIVGIGASAGGLEAFRRLLAALPTDTGMAYVLVQHLDPRHESVLAELLSHATAMTVAEVKGEVRVEPNRVYVIPPSQDIVLAEGMLKLVPRSQAGSHHMPVDSFLRSLAEVQGSQGIGVILSGLASDGTLGLKAIKAEGGIAFAQEPTSARHDGMPRSAIASGCVDFVLPPEDIARELVRLSRHPYVAASERDRKPTGTATAASLNEEDGLKRILLLLRKASGADFSAYKKTTLHRRVARRMALHRIESLEDYARHLEGDAAEAEALYQDCLISLTSFFRDPDAFEALSERVLRPLMLERQSAPVRIWVPGCATGEEAYSIAICLLEGAAALQVSPSFQIFATDLAEGALKTARTGSYLENIAQEVSPERLQRFFARVDGHYQISKTVREMCVFARHDLARDPPFSKVDLISCRNVLIYLEPRLQERVFATFHYALTPAGVLMLGPAESVSAASSPFFSPVDDKHRIYARRTPAGPAHFQFAPGAFAGARPSEATLASDAGVRSEVPREADRMLLARYGPAGVVVDEGLNIVEFRGDTDPYLEHAHGQASLNLMQMARKGLLVELRQAIQEARKKDAASRKGGLRIRYRGQLRTVSVEVIPIKGRAAAERCLLVLFETERVSPPAERRAMPVPARSASARAKDREIAGLKQKLAETAEYLNTVAQEHAAALEELQSTNEEALSSNEELQSVNEELQTAKEEIQSANEELSTLNQELQDRNFELGRANDDLLNLLGSVDIPIVMVGRDLRLRRFTPAAERLFGLVPTDVGRPLGDLRSDLQVSELAREVGEVIASVRASEREVQDRQGRFYAMRVRPYLTREHKVDGAVVVFVDVDALKRSAAEIQRALDAASAIVATVREPLLILDGELRVETANRAYYQTFRVRQEETQGQSLWELGSGQWDRSDLRTALEQVLAGDGSFEDFEVERDFPRIGHKTMALNARRLHHERGGRGLVLLAVVDRTDAKRIEQRRELLLAREHAARERAEADGLRKDELVATVSHELRAPLTTIGGWVHFLSEGKLDQVTLAKALEAMGRGVKAQERLLADLLDQSRIAFGQVHLAREPVDLVAIAETAIASVRAAAEAKGIRLELSGDHVGSVVLGDADRIRQVVWNLLFNSVKFTPKDGRVRIDVARAGEAVELTVSDTGVGIPADLLPLVFDGPHSKRRAQRGAGLGLGLKLVRELVELHGGTVRAESAGPGQGATFTISLPTQALDSPRP